jgi:hypothetical protein
MTERGFEYVKNRLIPSLYDIELDGAEKSKDDFFRKFKIILDDETKEEWNNESRPVEKLVMRFLADAVETFDKLTEDISHWRKLARQQRIDKPDNFTIPNQSGIDVSTNLIDTATKLKVEIRKYLEKNESQKHA